MIKNITLIILSFFFISSCSSLLKYDKSKAEFNHEEFDKKVKIIEPVDTEDEQVELKPNDPTTVATFDSPKSIAKTVSVKKSANLTKVPKVQKATKVTPIALLTRQPDIEDSEGFIDNQRRPLVDPFKVGERVTHEVTYLGAIAGDLILSIKPFASVNGRKNYNFFISNSRFKCL